MKRLVVLAVLWALGLAGRGASTEKEDGEDARLTTFFRKYLDEEFRHRPMEATRLGEHRFDHLLDDLSPKARAATTARTRKALAELPRQVDVKKLSPSARVDYQILEHHLKRSLWLDENTDPYTTDPTLYSDYVSDSIYLPLVQSTLPKEVVVKNCIARIAEVPRVLKAARASLRNPPRVYTERAIRQNRGAIQFYESGLFDVVGKTERLDELRAAARKLVPELKEYQKFLEDDLLPRAKGDWRLGKEKFAKKLELELDAGLTAAQVLRDAEEEFARVEREMYVIARQLWGQACPGKPLPPDDKKGRRETIHRVLEHFNGDHGKAEGLVRDIGGAVKQIKEFIAKNDILRLPEPDRCAVIEMPEFQRGFSVAFLNQAPPLDPQARSVYAISPPPRDWDDRRKVSFLEEYNKHMLLILTVHEAYPGHYVQLEYSNRHPSLIRRVLFSGVFAEGWAVYTEQMMLDQGLGGGSLPLRLNQLKFYLRAVANALLDYRMHCTGLSDEEAMRFLTQDVYQSEGEAAGKAIRAKLSSCQLSTYFVGRMAFYRLRQAVQREQGDRFDLGRYHEAVLAHGTLPVKYLPELVRERLKKPR
jgi:uncharacterized protein (DUF885 family)